MTDNQPRYTTARLHAEIAKAKAYAHREALKEAIAGYDGTYYEDHRGVRQWRLPSRHDFVDVIRALKEETK
ncbi:hypothetical protein [Rhizobium leucaenae]|uniref:hypothetical protein n=1 Tax=Rhizobium leucaenae TaxID=29450 RepID=UPI0007EE7875|nr:hypothetical protein [Rhizobium leucaenae]